MPKPCSSTALVAILLAFWLGGCKPAQTPLDRALATASSPTGGAAAGAPLIVTEWSAGRLKLDDCINLAFDQLDAVKAGTPLRNTRVVPTSPAATAFAGAVLEAIKTLEPKLPKGDDTEIFWTRVGGLAAAAAEEARQAGRGPEAMFLVLNGGTRWQNEAYWRRHATHDGLASLLIAESGDQPGALSRLHERGDLDGFAEEVYHKLGGR